MPIVIQRCHDKVHQGASTPEGLTEWAIGGDVNQAMHDYLIERERLCMRFEGPLADRIQSTNFLHSKAGVACTVEVHCNDMQDNPKQAGFFTMCWFESRLGALLAEFVVKEIALVRPDVPNHQINFCSSHRRWMFTPREYPGAPRLALLQDTYMPAVIVEACYLSNLVDAAWISEKKNRYALGEAVAKGIVRYLKER